MTNQTTGLSHSERQILDSLLTGHGWTETQKRTGESYSSVNRLYRFVMIMADLADGRSLKRVAEDWNCCQTTVHNAKRWWRASGLSDSIFETMRRVRPAEPRRAVMVSESRPPS